MIYPLQSIVCPHCHQKAHPWLVVKRCITYGYFPGTVRVRDGVLFARVDPFTQVESDSDLVSIHLECMHCHHPIPEDSVREHISNTEPIEPVPDDDVDEVPLYVPAVGSTD